MVQCGIDNAALQHTPERVSYVRTEWNYMDADEAFKTSIAYVNAYRLAYVYGSVVMRVIAYSECI
jgi:hypothetical protein